MLILVHSSSDCCNNKGIFIINTEKMIRWYRHSMGDDGYGYEKSTCIFVVVHMQRVQLVIL